MGVQPPQPVPAAVHFLIESTESQPISLTALHMVNLLTDSQLQMSASSGRLIMPAPRSALLPPREPSITSSGFAGNAILFLQVCKSMLYSSASPTKIPPNRV